MAAKFGRIVARLTALVSFAALTAVPIGAAHAQNNFDLQRAFDRSLGTEERAPRTYDTQFEARLASLANASQGRIGVAAMDLATGRTVDVLGSQPFPMASTSKIAVAATYLEGVEKGKWTLNSEWPLMVPLSSKPFSSAKAPVKRGAYLSAYKLIDLMLTRSSNPATDALLAAVGGPSAVNDWIARAGIRDFRIDRDIATLVRDDGNVDPAAVVDVRDAATPLAMVELLSGIYKNKWLTPKSNGVILSAMARCVTGKRRIPALMPADARVAHKTGSLYNTSSDVGILHTPDGRAVAVAIYVTGQGTRLKRESRIATIARAVYDGHQSGQLAYPRNAAKGGSSRRAGS